MGEWWGAQLSSCKRFCLFCAQRDHLSYLSRYFGQQWSGTQKKRNPRHRVSDSGGFKVFRGWSALRAHFFDEALCYLEIVFEGVDIIEKTPVVSGNVQRLIEFLKISCKPSIIRGKVFLNCIPVPFN